MKNALYYFEPTKTTTAEICEAIRQHPNIQYVSLTAVDLGNNHTDEKIPINFFLDDSDNFLKNGVQTDGSSVYLPKIAEINNAKVDLIPDSTVKWYVDYNWANIDPITNLPVGTLIMPAFLKHNGAYVGSRSVLQRAVNHFETRALALLKQAPHLANDLGIEDVNQLDVIHLTVATELEFWVKTPDYTTDIEKLTSSQSLKEQYWKRTVGPVRSALEKALTTLGLYGYEPEMAHKEVGGVHAKLRRANNYSHIMEQLEIDWKFSTAMQSTDHELIARNIISDIFVKEGLEVTFRAKPIEGVAGSGEHHHLGVGATLKDGTYLNLFSPQVMDEEYLNIVGYGALMGILHNYEIINPFVTATNDGFNRLKPGFEAPVCIVGSLGHTTAEPSRNRTVLIGLIRDMNNSKATRFELRAPNPTSNSYLLTAACYQAMLDGIAYAVQSNKTARQLRDEIKKKIDEPADYLLTERQYICENNIFEDYNDTERNTRFSKPPANVFQNLKGFINYPDKVACLREGNVFSDAIIESYKSTLLAQWTTELKRRLIPEGIDLVRQCHRAHDHDLDITDIDIVKWEEINRLRMRLMKNSMTYKSTFCKIEEAISQQNYALVSALQLEMYDDLSTLKDLYQQYRHNLLCTE